MRVYVFTLLIMSQAARGQFFGYARRQQRTFNRTRNNRQSEEGASRDDNKSGITTDAAGKVERRV